ncbi:hypothetical protein SVIOM74S_03965 [Streptomyces violarus]
MLFGAAGGRGVVELESGQPQRSGRGGAAARRRHVQVEGDPVDAAVHRDFPGAQPVGDAVPVLDDHREQGRAVGGRASGPGPHVGDPRVEGKPPGVAGKPHRPVFVPRGRCQCPQQLRRGLVGEIAAHQHPVPGAGRVQREDRRVTVAGQAQDGAVRGGGVPGPGQRGVEAGLPGATRPGVEDP